MSDKDIEIEKLLNKLELGKSDERYDALLALALTSAADAPKIEPRLKQEMIKNLMPFVLGEIKCYFQEGCWAAIALAWLGERSQDIAYPLHTALKLLAEDPAKYSGPMDEFLRADSLVVFNVQIIRALSLFKGDGEVIGILVDVISKCASPSDGDDRIKSFDEQTGPQFYDIRIQNVVHNCLRCIGVIGESTNTDSRQMLEWWSTRGNVSAKAALELFGSSWDDIRNREREIETGEIKAVEPQEEEGDEEKTEELLIKILNLCESDPDTGLTFIEMATKGDPQAESNPFWKWARAMTYAGKGVLQSLHRLQWTDEELVQVSYWEGHEFIENLGLTDQELDYLETALSEIVKLEEDNPGFTALIGTDEEPMGEMKVEVVAIALERCRPGKVQELMGTTKFRYFGAEHRRIAVRPGLELTSEDEAILFNTRFSAPLNVKAATVMDCGRDGKKRKFVCCLLYQKCLDEWGSDQAMGKVSSGAIYLFEDGNYHNSSDTDTVFIGVAMPGMSLPLEFRQSPEVNIDNAQLLKNDISVDRENEGIAVAPTSEPTSIRCPECNSETTIRIAKQGPNVGRQFHVCTSYPECKGKIAVE